MIFSTIKSITVEVHKIMRIKQTDAADVTT